MVRKYNRFITSTKHQEFYSEEFAVIITSALWNIRMKGMGPKSLIPIDGRPLVLNQIETLRAIYPKCEIYLVVGYEADKVIKTLPPFVRIIESQNPESNEVEELRLALNACPANRILFINGDVFFDTNSISDIYQNHSLLIVDSKGRLPKTEIGATVSDGKVQILNFTIKTTKFTHLFYLTGSELKDFRKICSNRSLGSHFMFEAVNFLLEKTNGVPVFEPESMKLNRIISSKELEGINENIN